MRRRTRPWAAVAVLVVAVAATACGIPVAKTPTAIAKSAVPFHLLDPVTPTTTATTLPADATARVPIYLVAQNQHVFAVSRYLRVPANLTQILSALLEGPTAAEAGSGLQTFLIPATTVTATVNGSIATVDFSTTPVQVVGIDETLAIAQVVFTATQFPEVKGVVFQIAGQPIPVPEGNGTQASGPVSRSTYLPQAPLPVASPA